MITDLLEGLSGTIFEEIRERPGIAAAILAGVVGALVGRALADRRRTPLSKVADAADLLGLTVRLLENPIVRAYVRRSLAAQLQRIF
jgi:uncharacterized membrane protein YeaQ/YmgE (transglycosylase-associated protein family)